MTVTKTRREYIMEGQTGSEFSFGRSARDISSLPTLTHDLVRSYQQPFHLRIHPDKWEFVDGKWRLQVERSHLRPGVGGVGGKERDLNSYEDTALLQQWAKHGDRRWTIIPNGDSRLRGIFGDNGNFLRQVEVQTIDNYGRHRTGPVIIAAWEKVTELGKIETDNEKMAEYSAKLATALFNMDKPPARAVAEVQKKYVILLEQLESSSQHKEGGGPYSLKVRINKIRRTLATLTGDETYLAGLFRLDDVQRDPKAEKRKPREPKAEKPAAISQEALVAALAQMSPEAIQAILDAKKAGGAS